MLAKLKHSFIWQTVTESLSCSRLHVGCWKDHHLSDAKFKASLSEPQICHFSGLKAVCLKHFLKSGFLQESSIYTSFFILFYNFLSAMMKSFCFPIESIMPILETYVRKRLLLIKSGSHLSQEK